jgi:hypothetical protein
MAADAARDRHRDPNEDHCRRRERQNRMRARPSERALADRANRTAWVHASARSRVAHSSGEHILQVIGESFLLARLFRRSGRALLAGRQLSSVLRCWSVVCEAPPCLILRFPHAHDRRWRPLEARRLGAGTVAPLSRAAHARARDRSRAIRQSSVTTVDRRVRSIFALSAPLARLAGERWSRRSNEQRDHPVAHLLAAGLWLLRDDCPVQCGIASQRALERRPQPGTTNALRGVRRGLADVVADRQPSRRGARCAARTLQLHGCLAAHMVSWPQPLHDGQRFLARCAEPRRTYPRVRACPIDSSHFA